MTHAATLSDMQEKGQAVDAALTKSECCEKWPRIRRLVPLAFKNITPIGPARHVSSSPSSAQTNSIDDVRLEDIKRRLERLESLMLQLPEKLAADKGGRYKQTSHFVLAFQRSFLITDFFHYQHCTYFETESEWYEDNQRSNEHLKL